MNEIATTIMAQLGGAKFLAMTGAQVAYTPYGLSMKLPKISKLSGLEIELNTGSDTYEVQGYTGRGVRFQREGVLHCLLTVEQLVPLFEQLTGLRCSL